MTPGPDLDALVARQVMGWAYQEAETPAESAWDAWISDKFERRVSRWKPSTDQADAEAVAHHLARAGHSLTLHHRLDGTWEAEVGYCHGLADTIPLAICRAALHFADRATAVPIRPVGISKTDKR